MVRLSAEKAREIQSIYATKEARDRRDKQAELNSILDEICNEIYKATQQGKSYISYSGIEARHFKSSFYGGLREGTSSDKYKDAAQELEKLGYSVKFNVCYTGGEHGREWDEHHSMTISWEFDKENLK